MFSIEFLQQSGYREYKPHTDADKFFQKRIRDNDGNTRYFINIHYNDFRKYGDIERFDTEVVIYDIYDVPHHINIPTSYFSCVDDVENHIYGIWTMFGSVNDIHNN